MNSDNSCTAYKEWNCATGQIQNSVFRNSQVNRGRVDKKFSFLLKHKIEIRRILLLHIVSGLSLVYLFLSFTWTNVLYLFLPYSINKTTSAKNMKVKNIIQYCCTSEFSSLVQWSVCNSPT